MTNLTSTEYTDRLGNKYRPDQVVADDGTGLWILDGTKAVEVVYGNLDFFIERFGITTVQQFIQSSSDASIQKEFAGRFPKGASQTRGAE